MASKSGSPRGRKNRVVNLLTRSEIEQLVELWFTRMYVQGRGVPRSKGLKHPTPYLVLSKDGHLFANPYAFSCTKEFGVGYPTFPVKPSRLREADSPPSTSVKSSWVPRLPVHCVLYRWYNGFRSIEDSMEISHRRNDGLLVTPSELVAEDGVTNRSRTACFQNGWYGERREGVLRCPHEPPCLQPVQRLSLAEFSDSGLRPLGKSVSVEFRRRR